MAPKTPPKPKGKMIAAKVTKAMPKKPTPKKAAPKMLVADSGPSSKVSVHIPSGGTPVSDADYGTALRSAFAAMDAGNMPDMSSIMGSWPSSVQNGMTGTTTVIDLDKDNV